MLFFNVVSIFVNLSFTFEQESVFLPSSSRSSSSLATDTPCAVCHHPHNNMHMDYVLKDQTDENLLEISLLRVGVATLKNFVKISVVHTVACGPVSLRGNTADIFLMGELDEGK